MRFSGTISLIPRLHISGFCSLGARETPTWSWGRKNRSSLVRVPGYRLGKETATRIELRSADPAANPYLAFACMIGAGLKGIDNKYDLPDAIEENIFNMSDSEKAKMNVGMLPASLDEAIRATENSELVREVLGDHVFENLLENKRIEWHRYTAHVSQREVDDYLPML